MSVTSLSRQCGFPIARFDALEDATAWIHQWVSLLRRDKHAKLAAVFDIDATLLTQKGRIEPVCDLYDYCKTSRGVTPFIITARSSGGRGYTHKQLEKMEIDGYKRLYMHPEEDARGLTPDDAGGEKKRSRLKIESHNYRICINAGDAWHDHFNPIPRELVRSLGRDEIYVFVTADGVAHLKLPG